jgi:Xaa-Pro aminopeptidase
MQPDTLAAVRSFMKDQRIDGWLVYDFRGNNNVFSRILGGRKPSTRRAFIWIPADGEPVLLHNGLDEASFRAAKINKELFLSWRDLHAWLSNKLAGKSRIAMEYCPGATLPIASVVDGGTLDLVRAMGVEVVSSANLIQISAAIWSAQAVKNHEHASREVNRIKDEAFALIGSKVRAGERITEREVQCFILDGFKKMNFEIPDGGEPIVGANEHSGDPHFEVHAEGSSVIARGDWVLIDLWARVPGEENIYSDVTWTGFVGRDVPEKHMKVFRTVLAARDASLKCATEAWSARRAVQGWELDDAARNVIVSAGHEQHLRHRTGHSLSAGMMVHGIGMNLDNLETHDTREMLPGIGFTIEPGIYLPGAGGFGVRSEINVYVDPDKGPVVTSGIQRDPILV